MQIEDAVRKVIPVCQNEAESFKGKDEELETPPAMDGLVRLQTHSIRQEHRTVPDQSPRPPHPSHFRTAPAVTTSHDSPISPGDTSRPFAGVSQASTSPSSSPARYFRRSPTVELEENPEYRPLGGPEYLKILAKYNLLVTDEQHHLVVSRFVNAGSIR